MGSLVGVVFLDNVSAAPCLIDGSFTARFLTRSGTVAVNTTVGPPPPEEYAPQTPGWAVAGRARIQWQGFWCRRDDPIVAIELIYDGVVLRADEPPISGGGACDSPGQVGAVSVWPLGAQPTPQPTPTPTALRSTITAPARVVAGTTLTYSVDIANTSNDDIRLEPCPNYSEWLLGRPVGANFKTRIGGTREGYALNCTSLFSIPAGGTVSFEMRLRVPADALGSETLRWMLDGPNANQATALLEIAAAR